MNKVSMFVFKNLPVVSFLVFLFGMLYFIIGDCDGIASYKWIGGIVCLTGLITFPMMNMLIDNYERKEQESKQVRALEKGVRVDLSERDLLSIKKWVKHS